MEKEKWVGELKKVSCRLFRVFGGLMALGQLEGSNLRILIQLKLKTIKNTYTPKS